MIAIFSIKYFFDLFLRPKKNLGIIFNILSLSISIGIALFIVSVFRGFSSTIMNKVIELNGHVYFKNMKDLDNISLKRVYKVIQLNCLSVGEIEQNMQLRIISQNTLNEIFGPYISKIVKKEGFTQIYVGSKFAKNHDQEKPLALYIPSKTGTDLVLCQVCGILDTGLDDFDKSVILTTDQYLMHKYSEKETFIGYFERADQAFHLKSNRRCATWMETFHYLRLMLNTNIKIVFLLLILFFVASSLQMFSAFLQIVNNKQQDILIFRQFGATRWQCYKIFIYFSLLLITFIILLSNLIALILICGYKWMEQFVSYLLSLDSGIYGISCFKCRLLLTDVVLTNFTSLVIIFVVCGFAIKDRVS